MTQARQARQAVKVVENRLRRKALVKGLEFRKVMFSEGPAYYLWRAVGAEGADRADGAGPLFIGPYPLTAGERLTQIEDALDRAA